MKYSAKIVMKSETVMEVLIDAESMEQASALASSRTAKALPEECVSQVTCLTVDLVRLAEEDVPE